MNTFPKPTPEQQQRFIEWIENDSFLREIAETGDRVVVYLSDMDVTGASKETEVLEQFGHLTYALLDVHGRIKHTHASGHWEQKIPQESLAHAAVIDFPVLHGQEMRISPISFRDGHDLERAVRFVG